MVANPVTLTAVAKDNFQARAAIYSVEREGSHYRDH